MLFSSSQMHFFPVSSSSHHLQISKLLYSYPKHTLYPINHHLGKREESGKLMDKIWTQIVRRKNKQQADKISVTGELHGCSTVKDKKIYSIWHKKRGKKRTGKAMIEGIKKFPCNKTLKLASLEEKETMLSTNSYGAKTRCYTTPQSTHLYTP